ncbi:ATP-binding protein [Enterococcus sp. DIV0756]|uniref:ATP-binding protein n=1 Tax=Enterococcus sp. DIV0756 TaxID=2774636 RepID=UPI003F1EABC0
MKIEVNVNKINKIDQKIFFSNKKEIFEKMNKMEDFCCLVSGYRGVGKTTLVKSLEDDFKNEEGEKLSIFIYQNLDKYESYSLLLRKLIRELFLQISSDEKFENFKTENSTLYNKIGDLHENSFFEIHNKTSASSYHETQKSASFSMTLKRLIELGIPVVVMFLSAINWKTGIIIKDTGALGVILSFIWFMTSSINIGSSSLSKKTNSNQVEKTLLYDDEIAEYHLKNLLKELKKAGVRVFFVFDEIDKIEESTKLLKVLSDLKHLLLMKNSSSIVISGQDLFYEFVLSGIKDDGLLSNLFSLTFHVPLLKKEVLEEISNFYFPISEIGDENKAKESYFDSLVLNTRKVARSMNNHIMSEVEWDQNKGYIAINDDQLFEFENDSKILDIINKIENEVIGTLGTEPALFDLLDYHLFLWVKKMKLSRNHSFVENEIFSIKDEIVQKYPYWYQDRLLVVFKILIERLEEATLIERDQNEDTTDPRYKLTISNEIESISMYQELTITFFKEFIGLEVIMRQINNDFAFDHKNDFNLRGIVGNLYKNKVITKDNQKVIITAIDLRNKIVHGDVLSEDEFALMNEISIKSLIIDIYEHYTYLCLTNIFNNDDAHSNIISDSKNGLDFIIKRQHDPDILFEIKIVDQFKQSVSINNYWGKILDSYNQINNKNNKLIVLVYFKDVNSIDESFMTPYFEQDNSLLEKKIYVMYIPKINTQHICKFITEVVKMD